MKKVCPSIFIVAGMPRCGTTFLYYKLQEHPSVFVPYRKETNYFSTSFDRGIEWYFNLYKDMKSGQIGADVSPSYFVDQGFIKKVKAFNPTIKIILGVRIPSEVSLSLYNQFQSHTYGVPSFKEYLSGYAWYIGGKKIHVSLKNNFVTRRIEEYKKAFGDNLLLFDFNLFQSDPLKILQAIESFLGLPPYFNESTFENIVINAGKRKNLKIVSYILGRESIISALGMLFPRRLVVAMRRRFEEASKSKKEEVPLVYDPADRELARNFFADDDRVVREMFSKAGILLGTGEPFDREKQS